MATGEADPILLLNVRLQEFRVPVHRGTEAHGLGTLLQGGHHRRRLVGGQLRGRARPVAGGQRIKTPGFQA